MKVHNLKIEQKYYDRIIDRTKTFEVRNNDRDYQVGDMISFAVLQDNAEPWASDQQYKITYIMHSNDIIDLGEDVIMSIELVQR